VLAPTFVIVFASVIIVVVVVVVVLNAERLLRPFRLMDHMVSFVRTLLKIEGILMVFTFCRMYGKSRMMLATYN